MESLIFLAVAAGLIYWSYRRARRRAGGSPRLRRFLLAIGVVTLAAGLIVGLWLPTKVPDTQGSPAALVMMLLCWIVGGMMVLTALITLVAAWLARPGEVEGNI
jgi:hypothetical protein